MGVLHLECVDYQCRRNRPGGVFVGSVMKTAKNKVLAFVAEIDETELTLRFLEIGIGMKRPPNVTAEEAMVDVRKNPNPYAQETIRNFERMARAAILFMGESIEKASRAQ